MSLSGIKLTTLYAPASNMGFYGNSKRNLVPTWNVTHYYFVDIVNFKGQ